MVIEACKLAEADGVDLSKYDYDGDGRLDNVYVFYAGAGEANGGSKNTVWPHRWNVYTADEYGSDANTSYSLAETKVSGVYVETTLAATRFAAAIIFGLTTTSKASARSSTNSDTLSA